MNKKKFSFFINGDLQRPLWYVEVHDVYNPDEAEIDVFVYAGDEMPRADYIRITSSLDTDQLYYFVAKAIEKFKEDFPNEYEWMKKESIQARQANSQFEWLRARDSEQLGMY